MSAALVLQSRELKLVLTKWRLARGLQRGLPITMRVQYPNELLTGVAPTHQRGDVVGREGGRVPMTLAQASYLMMLCEETREVLDDSLTETEAAQRIAELEEATGRGSGHGSPLPV